MSPARATILLSLLSTLIPLTTIAGEAPTSATTQAAPKAVAAQRHLLIQGLVPLDDEFLIRLSERAQKLGAERAGLRDQNLRDWFSAARKPNGELELSVSLNNEGLFGHASAGKAPPPVAAEIVEELVDFVRDHAALSYDRQRREAIEHVERRYAQAVRPAEESEHKLQALRQRLRELSGREDVSSDTLRSALAGIDEQVQKLQLEKLAKESRREALTEEIARASERVQKSVETDAIAAELKKVVEAREQAVQRMKQMFDSGQTSQSELHEAIARAAEARAKMLQQQRDAAAAAGGASLEAFNRELMTLSIDSREAEAKLKYLEDRLPRLRSAVDLLDEYQEAQRAARRAADEVQKARQNLQETRQRVEEFAPPRVLVKESINERAE